MTSPATILAVVTSRTKRRELSRLARASSMRLEWCESLGDVPRSVARSPVATLVVPADDDTGTPTAPMLEGVRRSLPQLAIVLLIRRRCPSHVSLAALRVADDALFEGELHAQSLWVAVHRALARRRLTAVRRIGRKATSQ